MSVRKADILNAYFSAARDELAAILAFWKENAVDISNGGFIGQMDNYGKVNPQAPKGSVLNARILWTFAAALRHTESSAYLPLAQRAYAFLTDSFTDREYGGVYWTLDAKGRPLDTRKQIYAQAFAIYGLSEYYRVTGEAGALKACKDLFNWIEDHSFDSSRGGYFEAYSRKGVLLGDLRLSEKDSNDPKTMNTHLHILEAYTNLYRIWPDPLLGRRLEGLLDVFSVHIVDASTGHLNLFFDSNWKKSSSVVSFGHDIEASWLLPEAAGVLGREEAVEKNKAIALKLARAAAEGLQPDGSLFHELDKSTGHYDKHREWWVSAEAMVGFLNAYQLGGESAFLTKSWNCWQFAGKYLVDRKNGGWIWGVLEDYSRMREDKIGLWKCPYHNARACMEVIRRCGDMPGKLKKD